MINNNRQQNGRRRGRGGQRQGGGGNQGNGSRIDNRARGNAAQLLEKYKSLASDAQRQGDRVNTEYYLQFADHYFRVVSEQRGRFEEQDRQRQQAQGDYDADEDYDGEEGEAAAPREQYREREQQRDGNRDQQREGRDGNRDGGRDREPRRERFQRDRNDGPAEGVPAVEGEPVVAEAPRARRGRPARDAASADTFDAALLPPSFAPANDGDAGAEGDEAKPRRRRLRPAGEASAG